MTMAGLRSWSWIPLYWAAVYSGLMGASTMLAIITGQSYSSMLFVLGVPLLIVPLTYRKLVGGACSLKYHICALVRGIMVGLVFAFLSVTMDTVLQAIVSPEILPGHSMYDASSIFVYQVWLFSGMIGGLGARIREVQAENRPNVQIAGLPAAA